MDYDNELNEIFLGNQILVVLETPGGEEISLSVEDNEDLEEGDLIWLDENDPFPYTIVYIIRNIQQ